MSCFDVILSDSFEDYDLWVLYFWIMWRIIASFAVFLFLDETVQIPAHD